jgi:hypothetical protein
MVVTTSLTKSTPSTCWARKSSETTERIASQWDQLGPYTVTMPDVATLGFWTIDGHASMSDVEIWKSVK